MVVAVCTSATITGVGASEVISQPAPTSCIQVPMLEKTLAIQSIRKTGERNGLQALPSLADVRSSSCEFRVNTWGVSGWVRAAGTRATLTQIGRRVQ